MLLTGRYPFRTGWTIHHDAGLYSGGGLDPSRERVFARLLRDGGYATGIAGKWQVDNLYDEPDALARHGFDEHLVWPGSIDTSLVTGERYARYWEAVRAGSVEGTVPVLRDIESRYWDPVFLRNGRRERHPGKFGPDLLQEFALDFLGRHRDRPFLLYYPMVLTHGKSFTEPVVPTPADRRSDRPAREMFAEMLRTADRQVGEVVRRLEELGLRDRTVVFVAADNGTEPHFAARRRGREVRGGLYTLTEPGGNVPFLVNSPALVPGGRTAALADFSDVLPTIADLAGIRPPPDLALDGRSLAPLLRGEAARSPRSWIFNQLYDRRVVRDERHKLYSTGELYDLERDPGELAPIGAHEARGRLQRVLDGLPPDTKLPFEPRSQSMWKIRAAQAAAKAEIVDVRKIWDQAPHNAFTDLLRWKDRWWCVFREGKAHVSPDGALRVLSSADGDAWVSEALVTMAGADLRDAKITLTPEGKAMLSGAAAYPPGGAAGHQSFSWFSADGRSWSEGAKVADPDFWLWRVTWHGGSAWGIGYGCRSDNQFIRLYSSRDGRTFETRVANLFEKGYPNESSLLFLEDGTCLCLLRRDGKENSALLGTARAPYAEWTWKDLGVRIGGPHLVRLPDGRIVAGGRLYDGGARTSLLWIDPAAGKAAEFLRLPSGGDTSYPGLVWHDGLLWVSYYASHEGKTSIYRAKVRIPPAR
jgi:arylsulfatase A-like enzyme